MPLTLCRTPKTGRGYVEPLLEVPDALPLHMVLIPGGTFTMGSPSDEIDREDTEGPQHEVTVPQFFMGRYSITQAQYERVMQTNPAARFDSDRFVAPDKPVVGVIWHNAVEFCTRLSELADRAYRLPSEAEWEYACRANTSTPFYFGRTLNTEVANYDGNYIYAVGLKGEYREETTPVNHFGIANGFGISDMHGNVYEWCQDYWHENYEGAPENGSAWLEGGDSSYRVLRGGSWINYPMHCRSASRPWDEAAINDAALSFRVVCSFPRTL